jgi:hypothetical protein
MVNKAHLPETCGKCHDHVNERYVEYASAIHGMPRIRSQNPVKAWFNRLQGASGRVFGTFGP